MSVTAGCLSWISISVVLNLDFSNLLEFPSDFDCLKQVWMSNNNTSEDQGTTNDIEETEPIRYVSCNFKTFFYMKINEVVSFRVFRTTPLLIFSISLSLAALYCGRMRFF